MLNKKNKKLLIIISIIVLVFFFLLVALLLNNDERVGSEEYLVEVPGLPEEQWLRQLEVEVDEEKEEKAVINWYDGYKIRVPAGWYVPETAYADGALVLSEAEIGSEEAEGHTVSGISLQVLVFENPDNLGLFNWLTRTSEAEEVFGEARLSSYRVGRYSGYKTEGKVGGDDFLRMSRAYEEFIVNSAIRQYIIGGDKRDVYIATCLVVDENYEQKIEECEEWAKTIELL